MVQALVMVTSNTVLIFLVVTPPPPVTFALYMNPSMRLSRSVSRFRKTRPQSARSERTKPIDILPPRAFYQLTDHSDHRQMVSFPL